MPQPYELTVFQASQQIKEKKLSPVDLAHSLLERIDVTENDLKAWVTIDREEVLTTARQLEEEASQGKSRGLLHGVPVGLKDIFYTAGMKTAAGSKVYADFVPDFDATSVAKIKEAGGIILGKAVTTEFATSDPSPTFNPWNPEHTPGGSSSGSSVAVATKTVGAALGSQTGGSTCRPAAYNGIVGLKATYGRISRYGVVPVSWSLDHVGILVRTVEDAALMLQVMSGEDENDPGSASEPVPDFLEQMSEHNRAPRIGIVSEYYAEKSTPEVWANTQDAIKQLKDAVAEVSELNLPDSFKTAHSAQRIVMNVECAAFHEQFHADHAEDYGPRVRSGMEMGML
ncbi:MAG: amidase family protein, partial [Dehalococcoidia bacterium]|nr:amidase family protein [Dehalococcoidia bacterium]